MDANEMKRKRLCMIRDSVALRVACTMVLAASAGGVTDSVAQAPNRSGPPTLGPAPRLVLPDIQQFQLSNGLPIVLMEKHEVPLVQLNVLVRTGSAQDPPDKVGLAALLADMLDEGAGSLSALDLADEIDLLGASLRIGAGHHTISISLHAPLSKSAGALPLLADVVLRPTLPEDELERKRKSLLTSLLQAHDEPNSVAAAAFSAALYGDGHPYGHWALGDEKSIRSYTTADLRELHQTFFRSNNAALIVVGDVVRNEVMGKLETAFGSWEPGQVPETAWPDARQVDRREVLLIDKPGAPQSVIRIGRIGVDRTNEDYYALEVMNTILGGSFTSRLNQNLREDKGYTYGAFSSFSFRPLPGPFTAASSVQTEVTDKALTEFFRELTEILEPVPEAEVAGAKNYVALGYPAAFQTVSQIARNLEQLVVYDLPPEYFNNYVDSVLAVSRDDVRRVAQRYLDPAKVKIVVVGDRARIEEGLRALNLGSLQIRSIADVLGKPPVIEQ